MHLIVILASCLAAVSVSGLPVDSSPSQIPPPAAAQTKEQSSSSFGLDASNPIQWLLAGGSAGILAGTGITRHMMKGQMQEQSAIAMKDALLRQRHRLQEVHAEEMRKMQELARAEGRQQGKIDEERSAWHWFDTEFDCIEQLVRLFSSSSVP